MNITVFLYIGEVVGIVGMLRYTPQSFLTAWHANFGNTKPVSDAAMEWNTHTHTHKYATTTTTGICGKMCDYIGMLFNMNSKPVHNIVNTPSSSCTATATRQAQCSIVNLLFTMQIIRCIQIVRTTSKCRHRKRAASIERIWVEKRGRLHIFLI